MHIPHTPESLLPRSDSKNPAATCRGLTTNGRPCRRAISKSPQASPIPNPRRASSPEAFCWQHREQATPTASPSPRGLQPTTIKERTSIDTLVDRLGLLDIEEIRKGQKRQSRKPVPASYDPDRLMQSIEHSPTRPKQRHRSKDSSNVGLFCCIGEADEYKNAPRPSKQTGKRTTAAIPPHHLKTLSKSKPRPPIVRDPSSRTGEFLSLIPQSASPQLTSRLLAELAKPFSESDDNGYIYMFWLTPESLPADPPSRTASTLLAPPSRHTPGQRRTSEILTTFASTAQSSAENPMLLKIGRAQNVHRRLQQWSRQCGYNLSLIRFYPYHPTTPSTTDIPGATNKPKMVPNVNRIERLIHVELASKKAQGSAKCQACGQAHREWFEVAATREGVREVDEVIRRWVDWGERQITQ